MRQIHLLKSVIDGIFEDAKHQADYVLALYKHVVPEWDDVEDVQGYPAVNNKLASYIMQKAMEFDRLHHPEVMNGGLYPICKITHGWNEEEDEANADLIAAAPELLSACERLIEFGRAGGDTSWHSDGPQDIFYLMMLAIGKAKGDS